MALQRFVRVAHRWVSLAAAPVLLIMIGAGVLLMVKKDVGWIQPPTARGAPIAAAPDTSLQTLFAAAQSVPHAGVESWADVARFDIKPDKGVAKIVSKTAWEVQVDISTGEVLAIAYRRSDLIESIHDGSFFAPWTKRYLFLPAGVGLFILWLSGLYLFALPHVKKALTRRRRARQASSVLDAPQTAATASRVDALAP